METLNRNQNRSLNGKLKGDLNENRNANLNGNPNGKLNGNWGKPDRNLNEPNLGPNWNQQASFGGPWKVLGPWVLLGVSLEAPWSVLGAFLEGFLGNKMGHKAGPASVRHQGPNKCLKCVTQQARGQARWHEAAPDFATPRALSNISH